MSESQRTPHPEQPAEGQDADQATDIGEGADTGRTPHSEQPAEGAETGGGADSPS